MRIGLRPLPAISAKVEVGRLRRLLAVCRAARAWKALYDDPEAPLSALYSARAALEAATVALKPDDLMEGQ